MSWDALDFIVFGALLAGVAVAFTLAFRATESKVYRIAAGIAVLGAFLTVWVNGAVGIIGNEGNRANLMFFGILALGFVGGAIARFKPRGTARALYAMAIAQVLVAVIALIGDLGSSGGNWPLGFLVFTVFFSALWLVSGLLFQRAARSYVLNE